MKYYTISQLREDFKTDDDCLEWLKNYRWPDGIHCVKCEKITSHYKSTSRPSYQCEFCGNHVHPTAGTIFEKSVTPLRSWFHAIFLMTSTRTGISAKQLQRELGVTYKTAWRVFTQIRKMMKNDTKSLFGQIEVDETYIGGKHSGKRGRGAAGKIIVLGIVERGSKAVVKITPSVQAKDLIPILQQHIPPTGTTTIFTDEMSSYNKLGKMGFAHEIVKHSAKQYVVGTAHTNNVEGIWSIIKNGIVGVNRHVSPQHMQRYLDSYVFRYNHRKEETPMFWILMNQIPSGTAVQPS